jgi:hypothetical protein
MCVSLLQTLAPAALGNVGAYYQYQPARGRSSWQFLVVILDQALKIVAWQPILD